MSVRFHLEPKSYTPEELVPVCFSEPGPKTITIASALKERVQASRSHLESLVKEGHLVYGVNTGFGDSCFRVINAEQGEKLQKNLVSYLLCGSGPSLPTDAVRAMCLFRLISLSQGYSGVSWELIERLQLLLEKDWIPVVPSRGSLGASGDLVPLAYLAQAVQGEGRVDTPDGQRPTKEVFESEGVKPYKLKSKEGLALVNGSSTMGGMALFVYQQTHYLSMLCRVMTSWAVMALKGRREAFLPLVNEKAKSSEGQMRVAQTICALLDDEKYKSTPLKEISVTDSEAEQFIQDRYSIRCAPQILGPVDETLQLFRNWMTMEASTVSDNPLVSHEGELGNGGNFYGGYLAHGMDYLKICIANMADMIDRQLATLIDEKSNRGLPPNLANWPGMENGDRFLHHGLKGVHQSVSAITSEIMALSHPNSVHSRSAESHNQDKVSLGLTASLQCEKSVDAFFQVAALNLICLTQALDLRGVKLQGGRSKGLYDRVRAIVPFVKEDRSLDTEIAALVKDLEAFRLGGYGPMKTYDLLIVGGGPGGATLASYAAKSGLSVALFEKEPFPRFQIGESLLPASMDVFRETGVFSKLVDKYIPKNGAQFVDYRDGRTLDFFFRDSTNPNHSMAFEVPRAEFDADLLDHARECGAEVFQPVKIDGVSLNEDSVELASGTKRYVGRFLADASGRAHFLNNKMERPNTETDSKRIGVFAHYEGVERFPEEREGDIVIGTLPENAWCWMIPFRGKKTSVGVVTDASKLKSDNLAEHLETTVRQCQTLTRYMKNAKRVSEANAISNYAYGCESMIGKRWVILGDAGAFLDPIFSSGVHLSVSSAKFAFPVIQEALESGSDLLIQDGSKRFEAHLKRGMERFRSFIELFYRNDFVSDMEKVLARPGTRAAFTSMIAGDVWNEDNVLFKMGIL